MQVGSYSQLNSMHLPEYPRIYIDVRSQLTIIGDSSFRIDMLIKISHLIT
jgi:hypothetical protein